MFVAVVLVWVKPSIGLCGIEISSRITCPAAWPSLQSDCVELKYGVNHYEERKGHRLQSDCVELKYRVDAAVCGAAATFNRTVWN